MSNRPSIVPENPFQKPGRWYRGNLHTHTSLSDGEFPPLAVANWYRRRGYDFLSITDHRLITDVEERWDNFLLIPGVELDTPWTSHGSTHHLIGLGVRLEPGAIPRSAMKTPQQAIDTLHALGGDVFLCHPAWSANDVGDFVDLKGPFGIEVFNYCSDRENNTGRASAYWDALLRRGQAVWGLATDDAHWKIDDACGGWVMVKSEALTQEAILQALRSGEFYASSGPTIEDCRVDGDRIYVRSSPVAAIHFMSHGPRGESFFAKADERLTAAEYRIDPRCRYVRIECTDVFGRTAWTQPVWAPQT